MQKRKRKTAKRKTNPHAVALGRLGGKAKSAAKAAAVAKNGRLGGRPRKDGKPPMRRKRKRSIARRAASAEAQVADRASSSEADLDRALSSPLPVDDLVEPLDQPAAGSDAPKTD